MAYSLKFGKRFSNEFKKIDSSIQNQIIKKLEKLKENPKSTGKPLFHTKPTLWEFKIKSFRIFYSIKDNFEEVWILSLKHKNETDKYIRKGYLEDIN